MTQAQTLAAWRLEMIDDATQPAALWHAGGLSELGWVTIAGDEHGLQAIFLADDAAQAATELQAAFVGARLEADDGRLGSALCAVVALLDTPRRHDASVNPAATPLVLRASGSTLRHRVWTALCEIPAGQTLSYAQLAARVDRPDAVRAVAGACAANRFAVLVPCHRVLRGDGSISGYRWGVERKRHLLQREKRLG